jgi:endonuclease/exonuclease/phosphatase (EEP) superfamily protein YafD
VFLLCFFEPLFHLVRTHHHAQGLRKVFYELFFKSFLIACCVPPPLIVSLFQHGWSASRFSNAFCMNQRTHRVGSWPLQCNQHFSTNALSRVLALAAQPAFFNEVTDNQRRSFLHNGARKHPRI